LTVLIVRDSVKGQVGYPPMYMDVSTVHVVVGRSITVALATIVGSGLVIDKGVAIAVSGSTFQSTVFGPGLALGYTVDVLTTNSTGRKG
jgi:hypothetical protein